MPIISATEELEIRALDLKPTQAKAQDLGRSIRPYQENKE
jgi:hypothetical protein